MNWNCTQVEERLSDFLDAQLSPEERAEFSAHLATCPGCTQLVEQVGGTLAQVHNLGMLEPPPQLIRNILDATLGPRTREKSWRGWFAWFPSMLQPRFAIGAAVAALSMVISLHALGASPARLKHADLNPMTLVRSANRHAHLAYARSARFVNDLEWCTKFRRGCARKRSRRRNKSRLPQSPAINRNLRARRTPGVASIVSPR